MLILGIETSCDETSVALLNGEGEVRANLIASQIARHQPFGGVVPEIASREHLEQIMPLLREALAQAGERLQSINVVAVTAGPGLIGALLVGVAAAQGLSYALRVPLVAVNHLEGHVFSPYLRIDGEARHIPNRFWSLVVSGGHSSVYELDATSGAWDVTTLARTRDDAAGEIFDKVGKVLGLPYPGGPEIDRLAREGDAARFDFPLARLKDQSPDFSFSGLKSNAIRAARAEAVSSEGDVELLRDFCASFQHAVTSQIVERLDRLWSIYEGAGRLPAAIALAGGVAANSELRRRIAKWGGERDLDVRLPEPVFCTDNAAMIAFAALQKPSEEWGDPKRVQAFSRSRDRVWEKSE